MNRIKQLREEKELNQIELGRIIGVSGQAMGMYEKEQRRLDTKNALILANYFNVSVDYLLCKSDVRNIENKVKEEYEFAYHKETEGLTEKEVIEAVKFYKKIKYGDNKED